MSQGHRLRTCRATTNHFLGMRDVSTLALQRPTLVLNRNWQPLNVIRAARALIMLWNDNARIVDPEDYQLYDWHDWTSFAPNRDEPFIQAVQSRIRVPEVIALTRFDRMPTTCVTFSRRNVFKRDSYTCQYCGQQPGANDLTIDHVVPRAQGGQSSWTNCVLACFASHWMSASLCSPMRKLKRG